MVAPPCDGQPEAMKQRPTTSLPKGRRKMLGKLWTTLFLVYTAAALPLFGWALANAA